MTTKRYKLHNLDITRVDLVDRGAAQDAHIVLAKSDTGLADRLDTFLKARYPDGTKPKSDEKPARKPAKPVVPQAKPKAKPLSPDKPMPNPLLRDTSSGSRLIRISPADFEVVRADGNMMEWAIPEDQLPEGVEEAMMTMVSSGDEARFQWMIDPIAGPPVEGNAKSAAEAFMAMRAALTNQTSMNPLDMLGGFPSAPGMPGAPGPMMPKHDPEAKAARAKMVSNQYPYVGTREEFERNSEEYRRTNRTRYEKRTPGIARALRALARAKQNNKRRMAEGKKPLVEGKPVSPSSLSKQDRDEQVLGTLELVTKGLVEVGVFAHDATGEDLRDILPPNLLDEISEKLSTTESAE